MSFSRFRDEKGQVRKPTPRELAEINEQFEAMFIWMLKKYGPQNLPRLDDLLFQAHQQVIQLVPAEDGSATVSLAGPGEEKVN
ncbi:MAG TPA: hypothetical protein VJY15_01200 [Candidatus Acidoferrum sp.]|nr:hypothetical protein [Candidatus Acidoferrum sp.]